MNDIINLIKSSRNISILAHESEDADAVGSCYAMRLALSDMGKRAVCYFSAKTEAHLKFMGRFYELLNEDEVPKTDLCICLDCGDIGRIGKRAAVFERAKHTVNIDHHKTNTMFAEANYVDGDAPATGEILYELFEKMGITVTSDMAKNLYTAISADTGSFKYSSVRPRTMNIAAELLKKNINHAEIARYLYDTEPINIMKFKGCLMNNVEQYCGGKLAMVTVEQKLLDEFGIEEKDSGDVVNIARKAEGCEIAVSVREAPEKIKLSFRSNGKYDVSEIALKFGGGGHAMAAGAALMDKSLAEVKKDVIKACEEVING